MKKALLIVWRAVKWGFIALCIYVLTLFFREERIPGEWVERVTERYLPDNIILHVDSLSFGFRHGLHVRRLRLYDTSRKDPLTPLVAADSIDFYPLSRRLNADALAYAQLPDRYYAPGGEPPSPPSSRPLRFPDIGYLNVTLTRPDILAVRPERMTFSMEMTPMRLDCRRINIVWPDKDRRMAIDGHCTVDLERRLVEGEVKGLARQGHIRPMLVAIDVPVALPYVDGFTDVPEPCPAACAWRVDLDTTDFDLWLDLHPVLGCYNGVSMRRADGTIHLHNNTREGFLYETTVGPISAEDVEGRKLNGTVRIGGTNGVNVVTVEATSAQPIADVLKIGGFTGNYVDAEVFGDSECRLEFRFPRAMTNNYEVLDGEGQVTVKNGQLMRMKGFRGLIEAMPSIAPAVTWFSDSTQASCDYVIENGIVRTDNAHVEGTLFSIKMSGAFDAVRNDLDFRVLVQFAKKDSLIGKVLHPLVWPFSKLLLEFRLTGSPEDPKWSYISVIDRVLEVVK